MEADWQDDLERWLEPYLRDLGNKTRRRMCPAYIAGLIGPGDRKSIQPMAARVDALSYDRLHHFIGAGLWDSAPLEATLWQQADELVGGAKAWLIIDDTALPKKGKASVGVAPQYATALGKNANCQTLVSMTLASGEVPVMLSLRLFLPESWTSDTARMTRAGVPEPFQSYRTKPEIAIEEIDRAIAAGVRFGCVLADAGYGLSAPFRQALSARDLCWAVGIPRHQKVYPADVQLIFPVADRGRPRVRHVPDLKSRAAHAMLENAKWRQVSWRRGTKGRLAGRRNGSVPPGPSTCPARKPGWWVSIAQTASGNTISRTYQPTRRSGIWPARSRRAGFANRHISNSRKSLASTTSKGGPGRGCIATH